MNSGMSKNNANQGLVDSLIEQSISAISKADAAAAETRVVALQAQMPDASSTELVETLIKRKAVQAGMVGAVTSAAAVIPGLGRRLSTRRRPPAPGREPIHWGTVFATKPGVMVAYLTRVPPLTKR